MTKLSELNTSALRNIIGLGQVAVFFAVLLLLTAAAGADCPYEFRNVFATSANFGRVENGSNGSMMGSTNSMSGLYAFANPSCTVMMFGANPPTACNTMIQYQMSIVQFSAVFDVRFSMGSHAITANGCTFTCPGGTCRIRGGDGLPVELLDFGVK